MAGFEYPVNYRRIAPSLDLRVAIAESHAAGPIVVRGWTTKPACVVRIIKVESIADAIGILVH